jgi:pilus assembly protein CpaE
MSAALKLFRSATGGGYVAALADSVTRGAVKSAASQLGWHNLKLREGGAAEALAFIEANGAPNFLFVDLSDSEDPADAMAGLVAACGVGVSIVAIGKVNDVSLYRRLIGMGVADYLVKPVSSQVLVEAAQAASRAERPAAAVSAKASRTIAMIGARGGVGTTTLAVSTAWMLSQEDRLPVVLLDLDLHFGSTAISLDIAPARGLREILTNPDRIDRLLVDSSMSRVGERLNLLAAEEPLEDGIDFGGEGFDALVASLAGGGDCVLIDLPRSLDRLGRHVLRVVDVVALVTEPSLQGMRDTQRLLALIRGARNDAEILVVANRVGGVAGEVGQTDFEHGIGVRIDVCVPFNMRAATAAAEQGKAMAAVARSPKTLGSLRALATSLARSRPAPKAKPSLIERMLGK